MVTTGLYWQLEMRFRLLPKNYRKLCVTTERNQVDITNRLSIGGNSNVSWPNLRSISFLALHASTWFTADGNKPERSIAGISGQQIGDIDMKIRLGK